MIIYPNQSVSKSVINSIHFFSKNINLCPNRLIEVDSLILTMCYKSRNLYFFFLIDVVNCKEKYNKICEIISECNEPEAFDDMANRHIAQCSAENIMLWCIYLDNFTLNDYISEQLALEYHHKRVNCFFISLFSAVISTSTKLFHFNKFLYYYNR